jgi:hypothetical protein
MVMGMDLCPAVYFRSVNGKRVVIELLLLYLYVALLTSGKALPWSVPRGSTFLL